MGFKELYVTAKEPFLSCSKGYGEAIIVLLGVPFDGTSTYKPGSRFAPEAIREASRNMESFSLKYRADVKDLGFCDLGDLDVVPGNVHETLRRLGNVMTELIDDGKKPAVLGGEHTITLAIVERLKGVGVIQFDAHMDLRDDYAGQRVSHATFARRLHERGVPLLQLGVRACSREEYRYARENNVRFVSAYDIRDSLIYAINTLRDFQEEVGRVYVTVDVDVLDPAFAPEVGSPEPEGLTMRELMKLLENCEGIVGFDVVEVTPTGGRTAFTAAKIAFELMFKLHGMPAD
ncbi:MAG: agmatinase [Candidatus Freyarchaeota archaeon]